jgi:hypothetical protein
VRNDSAKQQQASREQNEDNNNEESIATTTTTTTATTTTTSSSTTAAATTTATTTNQKVPKLSAKKFISSHGDTSSHHVSISPRGNRTPTRTSSGRSITDDLTGSLSQSQMREYAESLKKQKSFKRSDSEKRSNSKTSTSTPGDLRTVVGSTSSS